MKQLFSMVFVVTILFASAALAADSERVRGSITSFDDGSVTVASRDGESVDVKLTGETAYVHVVDSSLAEIKKDDFIGTATKQEGDKLVALELVIFPESMRGVGEGHYAWDKLSDPTQDSMSTTESSMTNGNVESSGSAEGDAMVESSMTNANVESMSSAGGDPMVESSMTNGNIESSDGASGNKQITVSYEGGEKQITVPASAPIVAFEKADKSALEEGADAFLVVANDNGELTAKLVAVGKDGVKPPM